MQIQDIEIVALVVSALTLFAGVLGWASWTDSRDAAAKRKVPETRASARELVREKH